jgi:peptidoglycan hydrolase CwlO-like protein
MKNFDIEIFIKDLDKQFNDMQDKAIAGSENVATASWVIKQQQSEIDALKKTIESLFGGLESSLALNKAQTERNQ